MSLILSEVFASVQGEGAHVGTPCVFIRLAGCNLNCSFCDTKHAREGRPVAVKEIVDEALSFAPRYAVVTGGEPMTQDVDSLAFRLKYEGFFVALETNGTLPVPPGMFDWVTVSPKGPTLVQTRGDEMKLLWGIVDDPDSMRIKYPDFNRYSLQPVSLERTDDVVRYCIEHPWWRLSVQVHRLLGLK